MTTAPGFLRLVLATSNCSREDLHPLRGRLELSLSGSDAALGVALEETPATDRDHELADSRHQRERGDESEQHQSAVAWRREHHDSEEIEATPPRKSKARSVPFRGSQNTPPTVMIPRSSA
jgi:hypothetical protein